jgi:hypothetical protein
MRHATRKGKKVARAHLEPIATALEDVLAVQDVEQLVFVRVDVQGLVEQRWQLLPDGKRRSRSLDQDRAASKPETFATLGLNRIATRRVHSSNATRPLLSGVIRRMHRALGQCSGMSPEAVSR